MDASMWNRVALDLLEYHDSLSCHTFVIWIYDKASVHTLCDNIETFERLIDSGIFPVKLEPKTTSLQQVLDCEGPFRSLKSQLRLKSPVEHICESSYCTIGSQVLYEIMKDVWGRERYSGIRCFARLGFSPSDYMARRSGHPIYWG